MSIRNKKIAAIVTMAAMFVSAVPMTALANEVSPHLWYGTERTYGEDKTKHEDVFLNEFGDAYTGQCAVLPKNDTFRIEKEGSRLDPSHDMTISLYCTSASDLDGKANVVWGDGMEAKSEKLVLGKDYPIYTDEVKAKIAELQGAGSGNKITSHADDPYIVINVTDLDICFEWTWVVHLTDSWSAPNGGGQVAVQKWASDGKGWWIQNPDGSYLMNTWYQAPGSGLWYYMGPDGYMLVNTKTPDGCYVNQDGVWVK